MFDGHEQQRFAALSGDFNPMHMDPVAARRTQAGAPVVHGIHSLLWLLDCIAATNELPPAASLSVRFRKLVYVGDTVDAEVSKVTPGELRARVLAGGSEVLNLTLRFGAPAQAPPGPVGADVPPARPPARAIDLQLADTASQQGRLAFFTAPDSAAVEFPHAARYLGVSRVAALACSSCLVGMVVPGLHSIFASLDLSACETGVAADWLDYAVDSVDARFRLVRLKVRGGGLVGRLDTCSRQPPVLQPATATLASSVPADAFAGATALIIGGSRGLGEVAAKLIAAGGGSVIITYAAGRADAESVAGDINRSGGHCKIVPYDVRQAAAAQIAHLDPPPTHLYYFATPTIFRRKSGLYDAERFREFNAFYVTGFFDVVAACLQRRSEGLTAFYPSTVYVEDRPAEMTEYAMSKAAGEILCADLQQFLKGVRVLMRRLPRTATDQTGSIVPMYTADPVSVMLPVILEMHGAARSATAGA